MRPRGLPDARVESLAPRVRPASPGVRRSPAPQSGGAPPRTGSVDPDSAPASTIGQISRIGRGERLVCSRHPRQVLILEGGWAPVKHLLRGKTRADPGRLHGPPNRGRSAGAWSGRPRNLFELISPVPYHD